MGIILASESPRRKELLERMGLDFTVRVAPIDETMDPFAHPADEVSRVAQLKAKSVYSYCNDGDIIIGADTIVVCDSLVMGKPRSESEAFSMLRRLSGREHQVMTGLCVLRGSQVTVCTEITNIHFRPLSDREIRAYVRTGEPMDKAGSYGIQGGAALFAEKLVGDYYNVVGLPVCTLGKILRSVAPELMEENQ